MNERVLASDEVKSYFKNRANALKSGLSKLEKLFWGPLPGSKKVGNFEIRSTAMQGSWPLCPAKPFSSCRLPSCNEYVAISPWARQMRRWYIKDRPKGNPLAQTGNAHIKHYTSPIAEAKWLAGLKNKEQDLPIRTAKQPELR